MVAYLVRRAARGLLVLCGALAIGCSSGSSNKDSDAGGTGGGGAGGLGGGGSGATGGAAGAMSPQGGSGGIMIGGTGGNSGASGGGSGGSGGSGACGTVTVTAAPPQVVFLIDSSGGMGLPIDETNVSRIAAVRQALLDPDGVITKLQSRIAFGFVAVGRNASGMCPLASGFIPPALDNASAIDAAFSTDVSGGSDAFSEALDEVSTQLSNAPGAGLGSVLFVVTDSEPGGCGADELDHPPADWNAAYEAAQRLRERGHSLRVITVAYESVPGMWEAMVGASLEPSSSPETNVPRVEDVASLAPAFDELLAGFGCELKLDVKVVPEQACMGQLSMNGSQLDCYDGEAFPNVAAWKLVAPDRIRLLGSVCQQYLEDVATTITANFPCEALTECMVDGDCQSPTPLCSAGHCVECTSDTQCVVPGATCNDDGFCRIYCERESDCSGPAPICDIATHNCVGCRDDSDCSEPTPQCHATLHQCFACAESYLDCPEATPICASDTHTCVECEVKNECRDETIECIDHQCFTCPERLNCPPCFGTPCCSIDQTQCGCSTEPGTCVITN